MILKKLAFTILAMSLVVSLEAKNPHDSSYVQKNPYVMQLLQKAGISVNFKSSKTFEDYMFEAKGKKRVNPNVLKELETIYKLFYVEGLRAPESKKDILSKEDELKKTTSDQTNNSSDDSLGLKEKPLDSFDDLELDRQNTEPSSLVNDRMDNRRDEFSINNPKDTPYVDDAKISKTDNETNLRKIEQALGLLQEVKESLRG